MESIAYEVPLSLLLGLHKDQSGASIHRVPTAIREIGRLSTCNDTASIQSGIYAIWTTLGWPPGVEMLFPILAVKFEQGLRTSMITGPDSVGR